MFISSVENKLLILILPGKRRSNVTKLTCSRVFPLTAVKTQLEVLDMGSSSTLSQINDLVLQTVFCVSLVYVGGDTDQTEEQ